MFCPKCESQIADGSKFCDKCGEKIENTAKETDDVKKEKETSILGLIVSLAVFAWNSYVIFYNFSIADGYVHVAIAIAVNLGLLIWFPSAVAKCAYMKKLLPSKNKTQRSFFGIGILIFTFIIAGPIFGNSGTAYEEQACQLVSEILQDNLGNNAAKCKEVKFTNHPTSSYWDGIAYLDNAGSLEIGFSVNGDSVFVRIKYF